MNFCRGTTEATRQRLAGGALEGSEEPNSGARYFVS